MVFDFLDLVWTSKCNTSVFIQTELKAKILDVKRAKKNGKDPKKNIFSPKYNDNFTGKVLLSRIIYWH